MKNKRHKKIIVFDKTTDFLLICLSEVNMKIGISTDNTSDLTEEILKKYDIRITPIATILGEEVKKHITGEEIFDYVKKTGTLPRTAAVNPEEYVQHFEDMKKEYDAIIHFSLSFAISSSGNNAKIAAQSMKDVYVIDTKSLSSGSGLVILEAIDAIEQGKSIDEVVTYATEITEKVQASFLVDTLKYLYKGGRCSSIALLGANILQIKPRISLVNGNMQMTKKYRGKIEDALIKYVDDMLVEVVPNKKRVFVTYSSPLTVIPTIVQKLKDYGFKNVYETTACSTISCHCGQKTLGILYVAE